MNCTNIECPYYDTHREEHCAHPEPDEEWIREWCDQQEEMG